MRKFALTALLLLPAASAQTVPAIPATPTTAPAAPAAPTPVTPTPVTPTPAATSTAPALTALLLTAPVGASTEFVSTTTSRSSIEDVQVSAAAGSKISEAKLNEARRSLQAAMGELKNMPATTLTGKAFFKVTARDASGQTTLVNTIIQNMPPMAKTGAAKAKSSITMKFTQQIAPDGKVTFKGIESDDPQIAAVFKTLTPEKMQQFATQNGTDFAGVYGKPLTIGEARTSTVNMDAEELMRSLLSAFAGPQGQKLFGDVKASPLQVATTTTYMGQNAQGQYAFETGSRFEPWHISLNVPAPASSAAPLSMNVDLLSAFGKGTATYRADGLPTSISQDTNMKMQMTMIMDGLQVKMTMSMVQSVSMKPR